MSHYPNLDPNLAEHARNCSDLKPLTVVPGVLKVIVKYSGSMIA